MPRLFFIETDKRMTGHSPALSVSPVVRAAGCLRTVAAVVSIASGTITAPLAHADAAAGAMLAQKGASGVPACMSCHGPNGEGRAASGFPRLAGQNQAYLLKQLEAFASGKRKNPQMAPIAGALSAGQMRDAADYFASLPDWKPTQQPNVSSPQYAQGLKVATVGDWSKEMPACFSCHGMAGEGVPPHFPALVGQPRSYTQTQLEAWRSAKRTNDPLGLMQSVAERMTDKEIAAVSLYLENPSFTGKGK